ncbi:MAG: peptidogalycan biosysnthesis protein, partial [Wenzhouxiangella sp.]
MTKWPDETTRSAATVPQAAWNGLVERTGPFMDWRFLDALAQSGAVGRGSGWHAQTLTVANSDGSLRCATPAWLKSHSHGEFVFDWAWASAAERAGIAWYPKLLVAAPYSPVPGPRLLGATRDPEAARILVNQLEERVERQGLSSAGVNFCDFDDARVLESAGWLARFDWQYHWRNEGYRDFEDFLDRL